MSKWDDWTVDEKVLGVANSTYDPTVHGLEQRIEALEKELRWVGQTVHQAHHEGAMADCPKNTCAAIRAALGEDVFGNVSGNGEKDGPAK